MNEIINKIYHTITMLLLVFIVIAFNSCKDVANNKNTYTLLFDSNGGSIVPSQLIIEGNKAVQPKTPKKDRSIFAGWYKDVLLTRAFSFDNYIVSDMTLYAKWRKAYILYFDTDGGSTVASDTIPEGEVAIRPEAPYKDNSVFVDWYDKTLSIKFDFSATLITSDTIIYAKWLPSLTVNFVTNSSAVVNPAGVLQGNVISAPKSPVVADSTFNGWYIDESCTLPFDFTIPIQQNMNLYAGWIQNKFTYNLVSGKIYITGFKEEFKNNDKILIPSNIGGVSVTRVFDNAFYQNTNITEVTIQPGITNLHAYVFSGCTKLTKVTLPTTILVGIGNYCFQGCSSLSGTFIIPDCVTGIGAGTFTQTGISEVQISTSMASVPRAFVGCPNLKKVILKRTSVPTLVASDTFGGADSGMQIFVPGNLVSAYQVASNWSNYASKIVALP